MVKDIYKDKLPVSGNNCLLHKAVQKTGLINLNIDI